jgi:ribosome biogenesis GTPase A
MPPKKSKADDGTQGGLTKAARFARVRNDLSIGFVGLPNVGKSTVSVGGEVPITNREFMD